MPTNEMPPAAAHRSLQDTPGTVYVDVRTPEEFAAGHPPGARNVPVAFFDASRRPTPNAEFVAVVQRHLAPDTPLLLGCQSGPRSQYACELLAQAGYTRLTNVSGGFGAWCEAGLPVERGQPPDASWDALAGKR